jgi:heptosyltransferase-1
MTTLRILVIRLSSMGDVIHALPAVAALKKRFPDSQLSWLIRPQWTPLLVGNPFVDEVIALPRALGAILRCAAALRQRRFDLAIDFQGLIQSAVVGRSARPRKLVGFGKRALREKPAAWFYSATVDPRAAHVVDKNMELASYAETAVTLATSAASSSASLWISGASISGASPWADEREFPLPPGQPEGSLPDGPFVLACPFAGWGSKQWPLEYWTDLARRLPLPLVVNGPPSSRDRLATMKGTSVHLSGVPGLIDATRRAHAVLGLDSGPLHLAAALDKPGVALFGPTDPARNGPYAGSTSDGGSIRVLRDVNAVTDYHRRDQPDRSMLALTPELVSRTLTEILQGKIA